MDTPSLVNEKYHRKITRRDWFKNNEAAYFEVSISLLHVRTKSHYARFFDITSTNIHLIENACALLQSPLIKPEHIAAMEKKIETRLSSAVDEIEKNITIGEQLAADNAVSLDAKYFQEPLRVMARIISPLSYEYLDVIQKADRLMSILENLRLRAVITRVHADQQINRVRHLLHAIQHGAYQLAIGLRARSRGASVGDASPDGLGIANAETSSQHSADRHDPQHLQVADTENDTAANARADPQHRLPREQAASVE